MKILVIGEVCEDIFIYGKVRGISPEAPVPIFIPVITIKNNGMAGNVVNNIKSLSKEYVVHNIRQTGKITKTRYVDEASNHMFMRVDEGDENILPLDLDEVAYNLVFKRIKPENNYDALIVSDYHKGFLSNNNLIDIGRGFDGISILDSKRTITEDIVNSFNFIKLNREEYMRNVDIVQKHLDKFIITLGKDGAMYMNKTMSSPMPKHTIDVSGAGDTFTGSFIVRYTQTNDVIQSMEFANDMSAIVVSKRGVVTPL